MSNKYPQYFTADGFKRTKAKPIKRKKAIESTNVKSEDRTLPATLKLRTANAKRLLRRGYKGASRQDGPGISPAAAKAIAAALTGMLRS